MTKKVELNKISQISKTKTAYIVWDKQGNSVRLDRTKRLDAAFYYGQWEVFEKEVKYLRGK